MNVNPRGGKCRECGGELEIVEADDATLTVSCLSCCSEYQVETDAFGDGCMTYYVGFMAQRMEGGDREETK